MIKLEKKFGWSELIAIIAVMVSGIAIYQSHLARKDVEKINKLDFRPTLALRAQLYHLKRIPPHIAITNNGPVDAVQLRARFYVLRYFPKKKKIGAVATGSNLQWTISRLSPTKTATIKIKESQLSSLLPVFENKENRVLEMRLTYRRDVDLKQYSVSAFYFMNQEGKWVNERSSSLDAKIYNPIKEAAFNRFVIRPDFKIGEDTLHEVTESP